MVLDLVPDTTFSNKINLLNESSSKDLVPEVFRFLTRISLEKIVLCIKPVPNRMLVILTADTVLKLEQYMFDVHQNANHFLC